MDKDPWRGVAILQSYKISCAIEIKRDSYRVYFNGRVTPEHLQELEEAGWKQEEETWVLDLKSNDDSS